MKVSVKPGAVTGPSQSWPAARRQCYRKAGSGNIFRGVDLRQLQRLFHTSGDRDAERRARLVWSLCGRPELASALWGLRVRSCMRRLKVEEPHCAMSRWLHAFHHLRIDEGSASRSDEEEDEEMGQAASCGGTANDEGTSGTEGDSVRAAGGFTLALSWNQQSGQQQKPRLSSSPYPTPIGYLESADPECPADMSSN